MRQGNGRRFHTDNALQTRCPARMLTYRYLPGRDTSAVVAMQKYAWVTIAKTTSARRTRTWTRKKAQGQTAREELGRKEFVAPVSLGNRGRRRAASEKDTRLCPSKWLVTPLCECPSKWLVTPLCEPALSVHKFAVPPLQALSPIRHGCWALELCVCACERACKCGQCELGLNAICMMTLL